MAKVWVKGYTKDDGTKVKGHYRDVDDLYSDRKRQKTLENKVRLGAEPKSAMMQMIKQSNRSSRKKGEAGLKRVYGLNIARGIKLATKS